MPMALDINGLPSQRRPEALAKQAERAAVSTETAERNTATARPQDAVSLTDQAQQLNRLQQGMKQAPAVDQQRVQALRKAINDGQYKVDPEKLAKAMASLESDLFDETDIDTK